jgi:hypothetical protein
MRGQNPHIGSSFESWLAEQGLRDGRALVAAMQALPVADIDIEPVRAVMPVRDVIL